MFSVNSQDSISIGFKGAIATAWLAQQDALKHGLMPTSVNTWQALQNGRILRLGEHEWMLTGEIVPALLQESQTASKLITVPRAECAFTLQGEHAAALMAQICLLNTAELLKPDMVLMTQIAGVSAILIRTETGYQFWCDISYQDYIEHTLNALIAPNKN